MNTKEVTLEERTHFNSLRGEARELYLHHHDCPIYWQFWEKHNCVGVVWSGPYSCFGCGNVGEREIEHLELPALYLCKVCANKIRS